MSRGMGQTKAKLVVISVICAMLVLESVTVSSVSEDLLVVQCKHQCKHDLHNKKKCEDKCSNKMVMKIEKETSEHQEDDEGSFCNAFCKSFEGLYQSCMTVCPHKKFTAEMMATEQQGGGFDGVANEAVCETSCSIIQERPLTIKCMKICHARSPGAADSS